MEEKRKALASLMFLTENRDNAIKAEACADGRKQREWTEQGTTALPFIAAFEAHEK